MIYDIYVLNTVIFHSKPLSNARRSHLAAGSCMSCNKFGPRELQSVRPNKVGPPNDS